MLSLFWPIMNTSILSIDWYAFLSLILRFQVVDQDDSAVRRVIPCNPFRFSVSDVMIRRNETLISPDWGLQLQIDLDQEISWDKQKRWIKTDLYITKEILTQKWVKQVFLYLISSFLNLFSLPEGSVWRFYFNYISNFFCFLRMLQKQSCSSKLQNGLMVSWTFKENAYSLILVEWWWYTLSPLLCKTQRTNRS